MWTLYESILSLCQKRGIKGGKMCVDLGLSKSLMTDLKSGRKKGITSETAQKIADYFSVSVDRVLNGPDSKEKAPALTEKDERDIERRLSAMIDELSGPLDGLMFDGEPIDEETRKLLEVSLRNQLEISKRIAKQKYTPKKYRKEGE